MLKPYSYQNVFQTSFSNFKLRGTWFKRDIKSALCNCSKAGLYIYIYIYIYIYVCVCVFVQYLYFRKITVLIYLAIIWKTTFISKKYSHITELDSQFSYKVIANSNCHLFRRLIIYNVGKLFEALIWLLAPLW